MKNIHNILFWTEMSILAIVLVYNMAGLYFSIGDDKQLPDKPLVWIYVFMIIIYSFDGTLYISEGKSGWLQSAFIIPFVIFVLLLRRKMKIVQEKRRLELEQLKKEYAANTGT